ncbi:hypothetical protein, partial [Burkholderia ubonensis]|uniref:hypothetical protein n=1 Tax=Burkholderia ubonensis TaxID=101571 RepID=UPI001E3C9C3B
MMWQSISAAWAPLAAHTASMRLAHRRIARFCCVPLVRRASRHGPPSWCMPAPRRRPISQTAVRNRSTALDRERDAHPAADAQRRQPALRVALD